MECFNNGWAFQLDDGPWQAVGIPHDWLIRDTHNLYKSGLGQYKKTFPIGQITGKAFYLRFDGIYMDSTLYVNGQKAGEWKNGYTTFTQNITPFLQVGDNEVLVTVNHQAPNTRWYSGAGIYRNCWLIEKHAAHFVPDGIYAPTCRVEGTEDWQVNATSEVVAHEPYMVRHCLLQTFVDAPIESAYEGTPLHITAPILWDINHPHCYILESQLVTCGQVTDVVHTRIGFRDISYSTTQGFHLNGRRVELKGVCQHHDLGGLGAAVHVDALRRQMELLKGMGVNAIRTAHNPPCPEFMALADQMGILVMTEFTDMWKRAKTKYDYARFFEAWAEKDVAAWVRRDRNSPSLIMWSIGNEIPDTHANFEDGSQTMMALMDYVKTHDPAGHAPVTLSSNYMAWENTQKCADIIKLIGYNYAEYLYHGHHDTYPSWVIYGGETSSTVQSRGIYHFPLKQPILRDEDLQCSALGNSTVSWGAKSSEACITDHRDAPFSLGQFLWTGTDYIGEPTPYQTKNSYFGQLDTAGFPKDSFYIYKAAWTPLETETVLHLYPHWDWSVGQPIDVRIATNAPTVALYVNGRLVGTKTVNHQQDIDIVPSFVVPYEPGYIEAVAYDHNGQEIARTRRTSFGDAVTLQVQTTRIGELTFGEIYALDADGNPVENANNRVTVTVDNGTLLALDNGDSTDYDPYQGTNSRRLFSGKLLAIVKSATEDDVHISATFDWGDTPIRKIELVPEGLHVTAKIHPANTTHPNITWRGTTAQGIDSPLGTVVATGTTASIHPRGDGEIFLRATANNGGTHPGVMAVYPLQLEGYGTPTLDPYRFVPGGLYNCSNHTMDNGHEHGVATPRNKESHVGFAHLDFGKRGADTLTMAFCPATGEPFPVDIWQGMPGEPGAHKLTTVTYDKGAKWNTYFDATFTLPTVLTGLQTICFVLHVKTHIKGFQFKAITQVPFAAHHSIYGDNFAINAPYVEGIGNNVSISFQDMDCGEGVTGISLRYRARQDKNAMKIVFATPEGEVANMLTLPAQGDYGNCIVALEAPLVGKGDVSFIFLPGTDIDLEWFELV